MKQVYVVIVNWNGWRDTVECLQSLLELTYAQFKVVVCDNGSADRSVDKIKEWAKQHGIDNMEYGRAEAEAGGGVADPWLVLIRNGENLGFAGGNNVGLRYALARGDCAYAWLLNNDTVVDPNALTRLVERMEQQPSAGICGSTILLHDNPEKVQALGGGYYCHWIGLPWHYGRFAFRRKRFNQSRAEAWMNYVEGASLIVSRPFLVEIGLMCEDYFLYFEEADWAIRGEGRFELAYSPESIVFHKVGSSIGTSSNPAKKSLICDYFNVRNRLFFTSRFYPYALPAIYLTLIGAILVRLICGKWDQAVMIGRTMRDYRDVDHRYVPGVCHE